MGEFHETYLICDPMGWIVSWDAMTIRSTYIVGGVNSSGALLTTWVANICWCRLHVEFWGSHLFTIRTGPALLFFSNKIPKEQYFRGVAARLPCSFIIGTPFNRNSSWRSFLRWESLIQRNKQEVASRISLWKFIAEADSSRTDGTEDNRRGKAIGPAVIFRSSSIHQKDTVCWAWLYHL